MTVRAKHVGFFNKGNMCYVNSILQALSVIPSLWSQLPSEKPCQSPLVKAVTLNMSLLLICPNRFIKLFMCITMESLLY